MIAGGGLCGASLACALINSGKRILVVESVAFDATTQTTYDERTVALTFSSRNVFSALGLWEQMEQGGVQPIRDIHVSNQGGFGQTHLSCCDSGTEALGYVIRVRNIGSVLLDVLDQSEEIEFLCPASVINARTDQANCQIEVVHGSKIMSVTAQLLVVADGGRSHLAEKLGYVVNIKSYHQSAILCMIQTDQPHQGRAYERFLPEGPVALLPHHIGTRVGQFASEACHFAVVWTTNNSHVNQRLSLNNKEFVDLLQSTFGDRAGSFSDASIRKSYPLSRFRVDCPALKQSVLLGNSAHTVHPVAGQGFNLGLRDVACLAQLIVESGFALGSTEMAQEYVRLRKRDAWAVESFTHTLIQVFSNSVAPASWARNAGLLAIEFCPFAKKILLNRTMGLNAIPQKLTSSIPFH
ncbi:MAG: FAD-dependent monooxygenase [Gammaproteobacteria bacterium]|nr:FAD-dependent monooxygenase [Gammaproteobacteria bacterium]